MEYFFYVAVNPWQNLHVLLVDLDTDVYAGLLHTLLQW